MSLLSEELARARIAEFEREFATVARRREALAARRTARRSALVARRARLIRAAAG